MICQADQNYLHILIRYQQNLKQRNALLKRFAEEKRMDKLQLEPYNEQLLKLSKDINRTRHAFLSKFLIHFHKHYASISGAKEMVNIEYQSQVDKDSFDLDFINNLNKDLLLKRTGFGTHKDDFNFTLNGKQIKKFNQPKTSSILYF